MGSLTDGLLATAMDFLLGQCIAGLTLMLALCATLWQHQSLAIDEALIDGGQSDIAAITTTLLVASCLVGGARMAWDRQAEPGRRLLHSLLIATVVVGGGTAIVVTAAVATDALAKSLFPVEDVAQLATSLSQLADSKLKGASLQVVLSGLVLVALISTAVQIIILFLRAVGLTVLTIILPAAAAFTNVELGRVWFQRCCTWVIALLIYKPAAALIYLIAFRLMSAAVGPEAPAGGIAADPSLNEVSVDLYQLLMGMTTFLLGIFALPLLVKLVTPAVGAVAGGGLALSGLPMPGSAPTGAAPVSQAPAGASPQRAGRAGPDGTDGARGSWGTGSSLGGSTGRAAGSMAGSGAGGTGSGSSAGQGSVLVPGPAGGSAGGLGSTGASPGGGAAASGGGAGAAAGGGTTGSAPAAASGGSTAAATAGTTAAAAAQGAAAGASVATAGTSLAASKLVSAAITTAQVADGAIQNAAQATTAEGPTGSSG